MAELGGRPETVFRVPAACQPEGTATPDEAGLSPCRGDPQTLTLSSEAAGPLCLSGDRAACVPANS